MELTLDQRQALLDRAIAWHRAPEGPQAGAAWAALEGFVASLLQEGEGERNRLRDEVEYLELVRASLVEAGEGERKRLHEKVAMLETNLRWVREARDLYDEKVDVLRRQRDAVVDDFNRLVAERDSLRNRLELIEIACTAHRVERDEAPADWHAQATEELARAEMSTAGHGDPHDGDKVILQHGDYFDNRPLP